MHKKQDGFAHIILVIVILLVISVIGITTYKALSKNTPSASSNNTPQSSNANEPLPLKSIGFSLDYYNASTKRAGDIEFAESLKKVILGDPIYQKIIVSDFGIQDKRSPNDPSKRNVQPTFILPLGTKVLALADSTVVKVEKIYSGDWTIWYAKDQNAHWIYETEHVNNPTVKVGDSVKAGQVVAEVSTHDSNHHPGFGILEIGLLNTSKNTPEHWCPYVYLDSSIKTEVGKKLTDFYAAWEEYVGDNTVYAQESYPQPGCASLEPVQG